MNNKNIELLNLFYEKMDECTSCSLFNNGKVLPFIKPEYFKGYLLIGEAPGGDEVKIGEPFSGKAGNILWTEAARQGLEKQHCAIINTVNCRPVNEKGGNGKPTKEQQNQCFGWIRKFVKIVDPDKILLLGTYPLDDILGIKGARKNNTQVVKQQVFKEDKMRKFYCTVHPGACIYNAVDKENLENGIKTFIGE